MLLVLEGVVLEGVYIKKSCIKLPLISHPVLFFSSVVFFVKESLFDYFQPSHPSSAPFYRAAQLLHVARPLLRAEAPVFAAEEGATSAWTELVAGNAKDVGWL